jgi:hypothetical protein
VGNSVAVGYGYDLQQNIETLQTDLINYVTPNSNLAMVYQLVDRYFNQGNPDGYRSLDAFATAINQHFDFGTEPNASRLLAQTVNN